MPDHARTVSLPRHLRSREKKHAQQRPKIEPKQAGSAHCLASRVRDTHSGCAALICSVMVSVVVVFFSWILMTCIK